MRWPVALAVLPVAMIGVHRASAAQEAATPPPTCAVTAASKSIPVADEQGRPFPKGRWYVNADKTIWAGVMGQAPPIRANSAGNMVLWRRPIKGNLSVTTRRLDGDSPLARTTLRAVVTERNVVSEIEFPTPGCWEITGVAAASRLTFVVIVEPAPPPPSEEFLAR